LNPDDEIALCPKLDCGQYMHVKCLRHEADRKCYECKSEFPLSDLVTYLKRHHKEENKSQEHQSDEELDGVSKKRRKIEENEELN
jgi:hypothetical protein